MSKKASAGAVKADAPTGADSAPAGVAAGTKLDTVPSTEILATWESVHDALRQEFGTVVFRHHNEEFNCSFSGGVCSSDLAEHVDALVECADQALYAAKDAGRNCLVQGKA